YLLFIGVHLLLFTLGSFLLFRRLRFGTEGAILASLALALGGVSFSTLSLMNVAASLAALPFFFYFLLHLRKRFVWGDLLGLAVAGVWPVYSGDPQFSYWMALAALGLVTISCARTRSLVPFFRTILAAPLALGLGAAQVLPALKLAAASERGLGAHTLEAAERWSLHPLRLMEFFLPMPFGNPGVSDGNWMNRLSESVFTMPFLLSLYIGVVGGIFLLWRVQRLVRRKPSARNFRFLFLLIALLIASLGQFSPLNLYGMFFSALPGWSLFRYPERLTILFVFVLFVWHGSFFRWLAFRLRSTPSSSQKSLKSGAILLIGAIIFFGVGGLDLGIEAHTISAALEHVSFIGCLILIFWYSRSRFPWVQKNAFVLFCLLLILDSLPFGFKIIWKTSADEVSFRRNIFAEKIQKHIAGRPEQIALGAATRYFHGTYKDYFPTTSQNPLTVGQAWDWGVMYPNISMYFGIANAAGYSPFDPKEIMGIWAKYGQKDPERLLNLFSVAYFPLKSGMPMPKLQFNDKALPYAWFPSAVILNSEDSILETTLFSPEFSYRESAVVKGKKEDWKQSGKVWAVRSFSRTPDHASVDVMPLSSEAYFVWNERFNSNWVAYYQGEKVPVLQANTWAMAVKLKSEANAGAQKLEFIYEDQAAKCGNWITAITLALMLIGTACTRLPLYRRKLG
ncbi:MAG: hypothetical protein ACXVBE_17915, partial [Bdellovibrionota bacterium]